MRLNKFIAASGVCSRRKADVLITDGSVTVNGSAVTGIGMQIDPGKDIVEVNGKRIKPAAAHVYYLLNKPVQVVSTCDDPQGRRTVLDIIKTDARIFPVGRLDYDSSGLLLLTNDGELANRMTHPKHELEKEYIAIVRQPVTDIELNKLRNGVFIDGKKTYPAEVEKTTEDSKTASLRFVIHEGRNRQIRKMVQAIGSHVYQLERTRLGPLTLDGIGSGEYRELTQEETRLLKGE